MELLKSFKPGPLDHYRRLASFDWKKLKVFLETEDIIRYKHEIVQFLKANPICYPSYKEQSLDETRHIALMRMKCLQTSEIIKYVNMVDNPLKLWACYETLFQWDFGTTVKYSLDSGMFPNVVRNLGTDVHYDIVQQIEDRKIVGCFALTEIGHGSNVSSMQTKATFDKERNGFVLHSPSFEAAKCWSGVLGQCATHAVVYAQLYTADGKHHGLQQFVVQVRDADTHLAPPGVVVADMGAKVGLNAIDNGLVIFNNYFVPKSALLNRNGDINENGEYVSRFKDKSKQKGAALSALSSGRISITNMAAVASGQAVMIAVRYAAVRKQFGPEGSNEEVPILEYQTHQHRLLPYLAGAVIFKAFSRYLVTDNFQNSIDTLLGNPRADANERGMEMHAISSACKPVAGWWAKEAIQECREACAGHGYLKAARFGELRNDNDANCTYEGENHVLIQQTSNWLLKYAPVVLQNGGQQQRVTTPYESLNFLTNFKEIMGMKCNVESIAQMSAPEQILHMYQWLVCYLLKISHEKHERNLQCGKDAFWAKNDNQVYYNRTLAVAYIQHFILYRFLTFINECEEPSLRVVLTKIFSLYALFNLERHSSFLYQGGYFHGEKHNQLLQDSILLLCKELKDDAVAVVDAIAPDDFILNSILGNSDGQVYEHLKNSIFQGEGNLTRPKWWHDIIHNKHNTSKL
ncbi:peroxisomal acyl-coenzyme A oxidase 3-like [Atheta coriaria]|uniref:peroxisomal acyl-coenzyme A oxidase 3-like n=1 Tax=Dalotia coriaria TaxID=877792 RepID=UPI0031F34485